MRILDIADQPVASITYLNASPRGGTETASLAIRTGHVDALPEPLAALLLTGDLQGVVPDWWSGGMPRLLGEEVARVAAKLSDDGVVPPLTSTGVIVTGDLYSAPDAAQRGASGDVRSVWEFLADASRWVAGVAGNHDRFGAPRQMLRFLSRKGIHLLDGNVVGLDGLRLGGVGLIQGNPEKPGRRSEAEQLPLLARVLDERPEVLILHESPRGGRRQRGNSLLRDAVERANVPLTVCGHTIWPEPLFEISGSQQILNVGARVIVLSALEATV